MSHSESETIAKFKVKQLRGQQMTVGASKVTREASEMVFCSAASVSTVPVAPSHTNRANVSMSQGLKAKSASKTTPSSLEGAPNIKK